ncbi:MAG: TauD/TfdA dioxygenase family protein [Alphaproteobacteria bacterium]
MVEMEEDHHRLVLHRLSDAIGIEVRDIDLNEPMDEILTRTLKALWAQKSILLIRGQTLDDAAQYAFARIFGEIAPRSKPPVERRDYVPDAENPMHLITDRVDENGRRLGSLGHGEMYFHTDKCYEEKPHRASTLYAMEIPSEGGHTKFASLYRAYEKLPDDLRNRLEGRRALQVYDFGTVPVGPDVNIYELMHCWQPIFVTNPDTGQKALYVNRLMTSRIEGLDEVENREVLETLWEIIESPDNIYEHVWAPGDIIVWDNLSSVHARTDWPQDERRTLRRCTVQGDMLV